MKRLVAALVFLAPVAACGGSTATTTVGEAAVVVAVDGVEIARYAEVGLRGRDPEALALVAESVAAGGWFASEDAILQKAMTSGNVVIQTSLDVQLQSEIRSILDGLLRGGDGPSGAVVAVDRDSGSVRALVVSEGAQNEEGQDILFGRGRPTGSALKPIALAAALDAGLTLDATFFAPECIALPDNPADQTCGGTGETETLLDATVNSINPVYVQVVDVVGVDRFGSIANELGIRSGRSFDRIDSVLGSYPASVVDMAGAYRAVAQSGEYVAPFVVTGLTVDGQAVAGTTLDTNQVLSAGIWADVDIALEQVIQHGTGQAADPGFAAAGKTGTARGLTDAWFVGYTDDLVVAVWIGFIDDPDRAMVFPATPITITGGSWPAEIWAQVVSAYQE